MKSSLKFLDQNLALLIGRAYQPAVPREQFVRELERALAPWIAEGRGAVAQRAAHKGPWPFPTGLRWIAGGLAAAAALLLLFTWAESLGERNEGNVPVAMGERDILGKAGYILGKGSAAVRFESKGLWRALTEGELELGVEHFEGAVALATPTLVPAEVFADGGWRAQLRGGSLLTIEPDGAGLVFSLEQGRAHFDGAGQARDFTAPRRLRWSAGTFRDVTGVPWTLASTSVNALDNSERKAIKPLVETMAEVPNPVAPTPASGGLGAFSGHLTSAVPGAVIDRFQVSVLRSVSLPQVARPKTHAFQGADFAWTDLQPGTYRVFVTAEAHAVWSVEGLVITAGQEQKLDVTLGVGGSVRGFVVEKSSGAGLAGALVVCEGDMPTQIVGMGEEYFPDVARAFTRTAQDGSFELPLLSLGRHTLRASGPGFAPVWVGVEVVGGSADGLLFELAPGGGVKGRCEQLDGKPFADGLVIVSRFGAGSAGRSMTYEQTTTNAQGRYAVDHLSPGEYVVLFFRKGTHAGNQSQPDYQPISVGEGTVQEVDFLGAARGAIVRGTVFGPGGRPLPYANLQVVQLGQGPLAWRGETTDADGHFAIVGMKPGRYQLLAGEGNATTLFATLTLTEGQQVTEDIHLTGTSLRVRVVDDETGISLTSVDLTLVGHDASDVTKEGEASRLSRVFQVNSEHAVLEYLATGTYDLVVVAESAQYAVGILPDIWIDELTPVEEVEVRLARACSAIIEVVNTDGQPVKGATVRIRDPHTKQWLLTGDLISDDKAEVTANRLSRGRLRFEASHPDYHSKWIELVCSPDQPSRARIVLEKK